VTVKFRGTTLLPRLKGEAKVKTRRTSRTRVELNIDDLPRASELGGHLHHLRPLGHLAEGHVDNLGEIKRSGSSFVDSKLDVTTPLQSFALILTAEPHFLMKVPSRMVVMENLPPKRPNGSTVETVDVRYIGKLERLFPRRARSRDCGSRLFAKRRCHYSALVRQLSLAKYAGASQDAPDELKAAEISLQAAEQAWRLNQPMSEIDVKARQATSAGAHAEEQAAARKAARVRREEIRRRDEAVRTAEQSAEASQREVAQLRAALEKEQRARELAERDSGSANDQLREKRVEIARLRDENQALRAEADAAKLKLARYEGEKDAENARVEAERRAVERRNNEATLKATLAKYGAVKETASGGFRLILPEAIWSNARQATLATASASRLEPLAALLASNPDYQILIEAYTDNRGDEVSLQQLTQERARVPLRSLFRRPA
jgi:outer membrane protein OmpA-like peptidoglycan-associated protein